MKLTKTQEAILIGTVLGDGFLQKTGAKNARLRLEHSDKQKEYLIWKANKFIRLFQGKPKYLERIHPINKKKYCYWRYQSNATPELGKWKELFYPNGEKRIPDNLQSILKELLSLAVWYMDDGYYYAKDKNSYIYLGKVKKEEAYNAQKTIEKNFNVISKVYDKKNKGYALYFSTTETIKLHKLIRKFILSLFDYKLISNTSL
jgi:hypothetical protein